MNWTFYHIAKHKIKVVLLLFFYLLNLDTRVKRANGVNKLQKQRVYFKVYL
jgi:hypothetical protein